MFLNGMCAIHIEGRRIRVFFCACLILMGAFPGPVPVAECRSSVEYGTFFLEHNEHDSEFLKTAILSQSDSEDMMVRMNVAEALGEIPVPDRLDRLWKIIQSDKDPIVREAAVQGLINSREGDAVKYLRSLIEDRDVLVRRKAALGFGYLGTGPGIKLLKTAFDHERDKLNQITLAAAMAKLGNTEKLKFVERSFLQELDPQHRYFILDIVHGLGVSLDEQVLRDVLQRETDERVKVWISCILALRGDDSRRHYLKELILTVADPQLKAEAAKALCHLNEYEYDYPYLLELLKVDDWMIRESVVEDLNNFVDFPLVPILGDILLNDQNSTVREISAWALGERGEEAALPYLEKGLYDSNADVRTGVMVAIYKIISGKQNENI